MKNMSITSTNSDGVINPGSLLKISRISRTADNTELPQDDHVISEEAVALVYNGISHAVMMATPQDLKDFVLGFSLSEGIIHQASDLLDCDIITGDQGIEVNVTISSRHFSRLKQQRRTMAGNSGCGLCGVESLTQAHKQPAAVAEMPLVEFDPVDKAVRDFGNRQRLNQQAGGVHGAAYYQADGSFVMIREDVGRHNALDKLLGGLCRQGVARDCGFVLASSRASYEMVYKALTCGIRQLVTFSAPTSKAIELARSGNLNLIGFARQGRQVVYHQPGDKL